MFKLIAVKVEEGCAPYIQKNLEGGWYLFDKDYTIDEELDSPKLKKDRQVPDNFFSTEEEQNPLPTINIHAIVGMNGSGKSALIEFILRLINNYSYAHPYDEKPRWERPLLSRVKGVRGRLVFEYSGELYKLEQANDDEITNDIKITLESINNESKTTDLDLKDFFYTILLNYSIHALNIWDYAKEKEDLENYWLNGLFHKNDGYQTPCVLNPWRLEGNIDINKENKLSKDRLIAIALMNKEGNIGGGYKLTKLKLSLQERKTLMKSGDLSKKIVPWPRLNYADFFQEIRDIWKNGHKDEKKKPLTIRRTGLLRDLALDYLAYKSISIDDKYIANNHVLGEVADSFIMSVSRASELEGKAGELVEILLKDKSHITNKIYQTVKFLSGEEHESVWLSKIKDLIRLKDRIDRIGKKEGDVNSPEDLVDYEDLFKELYNLSEYRFDTLEDILKRKTSFLAWFIDRHRNNIHVAWSDYINLIYKDIQDIHKRIYDNAEIDLDSTEDERNETPEFLLWEHLTPKEEENFKSNTWNALEKILESKDHDATFFQKIWNREESNIESFDIEVASGSTVVLPIEDFRCEGENPIYCVPPPIFDVELLVSKGGGKEIPLSKLSSGEKQLLYSSSSYLYHLLNLDSAHESPSDRIKYDYVNLICDEIELYFHPEYQRQFVDYMLKSIRSMNLKHIKAINILLSTHSPFILSDIPDAHVLYLKEGEPENRQGETFGANIHELLRDAFFLNGMPIGDFAREKILKLNEKIEAVTEQTSLEELERLNKEISLIGEPILRRQLRRLLEEKVMTMGSIRLATKTALLENRVRTLESEIRRLKKKRENYD